ncbi:MAG: hypothetical protein IJV70_07520 [Clostridia bacterium]|nr:hypothetical protein [Clostridia bacterium]
MDRMDRIIERSKQLRKEANLRLVKEAGRKTEMLKKLWSGIKWPFGGGAREKAKDKAYTYLIERDNGTPIIGSSRLEGALDIAHATGRWGTRARWGVGGASAAVGVPWLLSGGEYQPPTQDELSDGSGSGGEGSKGINWLPWMLGVPAAGAAGVGLYKILNSKKPEPLPQIENAALSDAEIAAELRKRQEERFQDEELYP